MPSARAWFAGLYTFVITLGTAVTAQYAQLAGTQTRIGLAAWVVSTLGALMAAAGSIKAAWPAAPVRTPHRSQGDGHQPQG